MATTSSSAPMTASALPLPTVSLPLTAIKDPLESDVLCGRGGAAQRHAGNQHYRLLVSTNKPYYTTCRKPEKLKISRSIVATIREANGRFLERAVDGLYYDIGDKKAVEKTSQALREGQPNMRKKIRALKANSRQSLDSLASNTTGSGSHGGARGQQFTSSITQEDGGVQRNNMGRNMGMVDPNLEAAGAAFRPPLLDGQQEQTAYGQAQQYGSDPSALAAFRNLQAEAAAGAAAYGSQVDQGGNQVTNFKQQIQAQRALMQLYQRKLDQRQRELQALQAQQRQMQMQQQMQDTGLASPNDQTNQANQHLGGAVGSGQEQFADISPIGHYDRDVTEHSSNITSGDGGDNDRRSFFEEIRPPSFVTRSLAEEIQHQQEELQTLQTAAKLFREILLQSRHDLFSIDPARCVEATQRTASHCEGSKDTTTMNEEYQEGFLYLSFPGSEGQMKVELPDTQDTQQHHPSSITMGTQNSTSTTICSSSGSAGSSNIGALGQQRPAKRRRMSNVGTNPDPEVATQDVTTEASGAITKKRKHVPWEERFEELARFKRQDGHCDVPLAKEPLNLWVNTQRVAYQKKKKGKPSTLTDERERKLESIGFTWKSGRTWQWEESFKDLMAYKERHGHCRVLVSSEGLGSWVGKQRAEYRKKKKGEETSLTDERERKLESIGFTWVAHPGRYDLKSWEDRFRQLVAYKAKHGDCNVPVREKGGLGKWVGTQRRNYRLKAERKSDALTDELEDRLDRLGFQWKVREGNWGGTTKKFTWQERYEELCDYEGRFGHSDVRHNEGHDALAQWCAAQRCQFGRKQRGEKNSLTDEREQLLQCIDFQFSLK